MGTNYYAIADACASCGRYERIHICKSLISFQGQFRDDEWDASLGRFVEVPWLVSWADWKEFLRSPAVSHVEDEYGGQHSVPEFIGRVSATGPEARRRQHDWMSANKPQRIVTEPRRDHDWLDADGFSFYGGAFS